MDLSNVLVLASASGFLVKGGVDVLRALFDSVDGRITLALAFVVGPVVAAIFSVATGSDLASAQEWAQVVLAGWIAASGAVGLTEMQNKSTEIRVNRSLYEKRDP